ncbi:Nicotinate-nucleotide--dimethylbenzimidazole phosphoribosyltransferase [Candidatus Terasakiella magnetica]|uniref:Nicotinate-nucleotide--dimethylbenzimidazole phosphoribosyltransferase n=1 Tax=Candidatus Terasakiella magnetica TaxID=1867952 RepID=A0A1C3REX5_9PROT|nr:nicotinate-nucleotide--dimethylbenzimidazole phosphoribosyltransferase [Candidatus Terasakiella magnetica]SCA55811.1 Nicotinate-nucleotide--dimethylbenzimidazole phosphoribosyltransferase [Candidatus Terasakiella magnetica]
MNTLPHVKSLDDIREVLKVLPEFSQSAKQQADAREPQLTKPEGSLGRLEEVSHWVARWQGSYPPRAKSVHCNVYAGNHGVVARGVSAYPPEVTGQMVQNFINGGAAVNQICATFDVDLQVHEMALDQPTADFSKGPAMSDEDMAEAFFYGMTTVKDHTDLLCIGEMGIGNTTSAAAVAHGLYGGAAETWVGRGTGVDDEAMGHKIAVVAESVLVNKDAMKDGLDVLRCLGGRELVAMAGAVVAARMKRIPVLLDGYVCTSAVAALEATCKGALDHCMVAHNSVEPGHQLLCEKIGKKALFDLDMRLGEASGAVLAVGLVRSAVACHNNMATFGDAGVATKD